MAAGSLEDSLGICRLCTPNLALTLECTNAVTGWEWGVDEAREIGIRIVDLMRMFNFRHGLTQGDGGAVAALQLHPGQRPGGRATASAEHWDAIRDNYYEQMGWDVATGRPLPETLRRDGLDYAIEESVG